MTKDEALKLALEFIENSECGTADLEARIKEALAQPVSSHGNAEDLYVEMSKHLNCPHCGGSGHIDDVAQPEQEPTKAMIDAAERINWSDSDVRGNIVNMWQAMYAVAPPSPQRTWVGLTDEDVREVSYDFPPSIAEWYDRDFTRFIHALEAKLKEKNTRQDGDCKHCVNGCPACDARRQSNVLP